MKQKKTAKLSKDVLKDKVKTNRSTEQLFEKDSPMDEDVIGSSKPISQAKPDMLREDHPGLAK